MDVMQIIGTGLTAALGPVGAFYALAAMGLNIHYGYTGLLNFGQVAFMMVGGYGMAISVAIFELPFLVGVLIGLAAAAVLALILGIPTLRLRADYLAITTIAAGEILRLLINSSPATQFTGGPFGLPSQVSDNRRFTTTFLEWNPIPAGDYGFSTIKFNATSLWLLVVLWLLVALTAWAIHAIMRSPWGRVIKSIREDEDAARSLGKNVFVYKMQSLVMGGLLGGLAGIGMSLTLSNANPVNFLPQVTFFAFTIMILGGAATVTGPVAGSIAFWFLVAGLDQAIRDAGMLPSGTEGAFRLAFVGLGLMLLIVFRPQGILGNKQELMLNG